jgi:hypothetical protein
MVEHCVPQICQPLVSGGRQPFKISGVNFQKFARALISLNSEKLLVKIQQIDPKEAKYRTFSGSSK